MWNFLKIDRLLTKSFTQNIIISEKFSQRRSTKGKICQSHKFIWIIRFSEGVNGVVKIASSLKRLHGEIFLTEFVGTFFFSSRCLFFSGKGENTPRKTPAETQSIKIQVIQVNSSTSPEVRWKNYAKRRDSQS